MSELILMLLADARLPVAGHTQSAGLEPALRLGLEASEVPPYLAARLASVTRVEAATAVVALHHFRAGLPLEPVDDGVGGAYAERRDARHLALHGPGHAPARVDAVARRAVDRRGERPERAVARRRPRRGGGRGRAVAGGASPGWSGTTTS